MHLRALQHTLMDERSTEVHTEYAIADSNAKILMASHCFIRTCDLRGWQPSSCR